MGATPTQYRIPVTIPEGVCCLSGNMLDQALSRRVSPHIVDDVAAEVARMMRSPGNEYTRALYEAFDYIVIAAKASVEHNVEAVTRNAHHDAA